MTVSAFSASTIYPALVLTADYQTMTLGGAVGIERMQRLLGSAQKLDRMPTETPLNQIEMRR